MAGYWSGRRSKRGLSRCHRKKPEPDSRPTLPGCIAPDASRDKTKQRMREAVEFHLEGLLKEGYPIPEPSSQAVFFDLAESGAFWGDRQVEILSDIQAFTARARIAPSTPIATVSGASWVGDRYSLTPI